MAEFFDRAIDIAAEVKATPDGSKLKAFRAFFADGVSAHSGLAALKSEVEDFTRSFPTIGFESDDMRYP